MKFRELVTKLHTYKVDWGNDGYSSTPDRVPADLAEANAVSSFVKDSTPEEHLKNTLFDGPTSDEYRASYGKHVVAVDIDKPVLAVPSTTPGNYHLYIDHEMTWPQYSKLLDVMAEVGLVEPGYVAATKRRCHSDLRLPWVKKEPVPQVVEAPATVTNGIPVEDLRF